MSLPPKPFFTLDEAAARWGCMPRDIAGWAAAGKIEITTGIAPTRCEGGIKAGIVKVPIADLIPLFRSGVTGSDELHIGRVAEAGSDQWAFVLEPAGLAVARDDLRISREEVTRFETSSVFWVVAAVMVQRRATIGTRSTER